LETINTNKTNIAGRISALPSEIDRIMAKIDQDNRVLAELDKTRSTIGENNLQLFRTNLSEVYNVNMK
jgi:peptidoglycan hydrolase CwlO-like protein